MFGTKFELNETTIPIIEQLGSHMPGGFFIYKASEPQQLLYANRAVFDLYGCEDEQDFRELTGYTFRGMVHPDDYEAVCASIDEQIATEQDELDYVEYRIVCKDGTVRWVDDYGHVTGTELYGDIFYVFVSDVTEKRQRTETVMATRQAVVEALSKSYHTVWLIEDVQTERFSLYRGDIAGDTVHAQPIQDALTQMKYSQAKEYYINTMVAKVDRERLQRELTIDSIMSRLKDRGQFNINYLRVMDDGSERYFRIEFAQADMPDNKVGVVCGFRDVDDDVREGQAMQKALAEAKKAEDDKLKLMEQVRSAARLAELMGSVASLLSNMPAMSFSKDAATGKYLACNQAFAEYAHKKNPDGVIGLTDHEIFDPVTADHFLEDDQKALSMDEAYVFFEDVPDAKGNMRYLQTTKLKFVDDNGRLCTLGMCVDVTEMTKAKAAEAEARVKQQELEEKLALHSQLLEQEKSREQQTQLITALASDYFSVYYLELDTDDGVCYQSHPDVKGFRVGERFKYLEAVTAYANANITDEYRDEFLRFIQPDNIREGLKDQRVISYRYMVHRNGRDSYEMVKFAGVRHPEDRDDHIVHSVGACFCDIDAETRKNLEQNQALNDALTAAEEASKAKTAFLSNMSHEIRTPMNAIIGLDNIAMSDPDTSPKARDYLQKIDTSAKHLLSIINDILDMSRIESGRMVIKREEFSFSKGLEQVNTIISGQCRDKGLHYECRLNGTIDDYFVGDDMKLRQVMINILGNAVKFTDPGGTVTFTIEEMARFDGKVTLRFTIADTGVGMSKEYLPRLFDAFSQEDSSAANSLGSTGLGMPITKNIVEMMNGSIDVQSEKGVGTTFVVTVTLGESTHVASDLDDTELTPHEMHVLVIDDDPIACEHATLVLGQVGISCDAAQSGMEALSMVEMRHGRREDYTLILVDWKMPQMDGVETTRRIRQIVGSDTPIIILTSYHWDDIIDEARSAGVDSFVPKPLFAGTVLDEFKEAFKKKNELLLASKADLKGRRILMAEDVEINAEILVMILAAREMDVDVAENGQLAVDMFAARPEGYYDAILMDMRMPVMNGLDATRAIRALDRSDARTVPIIALTANAFDEDVQRSLQAGLNAHLSKPIEPDALFSTLESLID